MNVLPLLVVYLSWPVLLLIAHLHLRVARVKCFISSLHQKHRKQMSLPSDDFHHPSGEISPGGTLVKNRGSSAKLSLFSLQPQNSKVHLAVIFYVDSCVLYDVSC